MFDHAEAKASVVAAMEQRIVHLERSVARCEVKRDGLVVPKDAAMAKFEMIDERAKSRSTRLWLAIALAFRGGKWCSVGIEGHVDNGLLDDDFVEAKLGTDKRTDFQARDNAVRMG